MVQVLNAYSTPWEQTFSLSSEQIADNAFVEIEDPAGETSLLNNWQPDPADTTMVPDVANPGGGGGKDVEDNIDTIEFDNLTGVTQANIMSFAMTQGSDVMFDFAAEGSVLVENATIAQLTNDVEVV